VDELLTIGQFSRMCWLSVKTLRLYDEVGLLHPTHVDVATNYRYYRPEQAPVARAAAILRSLDMPLAEIKDVVTESDPDKVRARLDAHRAVLRQRIERHRDMLSRVEAFIRRGAVMTYDIVIKELEPVDVVGLTLRTSPEAISTDAAAAYARLYEVLGREGIVPAGPPRLVYQQMSEDAWTIETCVPVAGATGAPDGLALRRLPGGRVAATVHVGPYDELGMAYRELEVWMGKQGLTPSGPPFDIYLNDPSEVEDSARFQTELLWPAR
jgi:DNA-binding transcriptional MerR regulator